MGKKILALIMAGCMMGVPMHTFAATKNHIPHITTAKKDEVIVGEIVIDNSYGDLQAGHYFSIDLEGAEFDFRDNGTPKVYGENMEFRRSSDTSVYGEVLGSRNKYTISFFSKIRDKQAKILINGEDSGLSSGTYVFAVTSQTGEAYKGIVEHKVMVLASGAIDLDPIIIAEPHTAAFRTLVNDRSSDTLIKVELENKDFELMGARSGKPITFVVDDGEDTTTYQLGRDPEVAFDYSSKTITFTKQNRDIFEIDGENYSVELMNIRLNPKSSNIGDQDVDFKLSGLLVEEQTITIAKKIRESLVLKASKEEIKPGEDHRVKFSIQEAIPGTLFSKGYIDLGVRGGATINMDDNFVLTLKDGNKAYTQKDLDLILDPQKDQINMKGLEREGSRNLLTIEGEFTVEAPERVTDEIYMFINEPSVSGVVKQTILTASEEMIQPPLPPAPKPPRVEFTMGQAFYTLDGANQSMDARAYISIHDRIMVPVRYVAYALGVDEEDLKWDGPSQTVTLEGDKYMTINIETGTMMVDGKASGLSETRLMGGRTFVPVGEIGRAFGVEVKWDPDTRTATFN